MALNLYISEYEHVRQTSRGNVLAGVEPSVATQKVDFTAGSTASAAFNVRTKFVRIHAEAICSIVFGTAPTAAATGLRLTAGQTEYFGVDIENFAAGAMKVAAITNT